MLIDWFTVIAQLVNFVILVVALKFLLYDRLMEAMERRQRSIAAREATAEERIRQAEEELARLRRRREELDSQRDDILASARREAAEERRRLQRQIREDMDRQREEWQNSLHRRQDRLLRELQRLTAEKAVSISRRLLEDLADRSLEDAVIRGLVTQVEQIPQAQRAALAESVRSDGSPIVVRSAFRLSDADRHHVHRALSYLAGDQNLVIHWEQDPELIAGVVVQIGARTLEWSVAGYLDEVERDFADLLRSETGHPPGK